MRVTKASQAGEETRLGPEELEQITEHLMAEIYRLGEGLE